MSKNKIARKLLRPQPLGLLIVLMLTGVSITGAGQANRLNSQSGLLRVCYDQWPPMTIFPTEQSTGRGVVIDMIEQIYTAKGYKLEYYEVPLARGLDLVAEGVCDMLPEYLFSHNAEKGFVYAAEPSFEYTSAFVVRRDDPWRYQGIESIKGKRIATGLGWDYSSMSLDYQGYIDDVKNANFIETIAGYDDVVDRAFHMIKEHRVDLYADSDLVLQHALNRLHLSDSLKVVRPGLEKRLVEMPIFSVKIPTEKREQLIRIWNEGRVSMKGKKEQKLLKKYNVMLEADSS